MAPSLFNPRHTIHRPVPKRTFSHNAVAKQEYVTCDQNLPDETKYSKNLASVPDHVK
jgi:hypothetical protein